MKSPWLLTHSGVEFDLTEPTPDMVNIHDIAFHLARIRRFNGATKANCSVALHSVLVSMMVPEIYAKDALLHDAHEAYIGDISTPIKIMLEASFVHLNFKIKEVVRRRFELQKDPPSSMYVKKADLQSLKYERDNFMPKTDRPWEILEGLEDGPKCHPLYLNFYQIDDPTLHERLFIDRSVELGLFSPVC